MIIIAGPTLTESGTRDAAIQAFSNMLERARKRDGSVWMAEASSGDRRFCDDVQRTMSISDKLIRLIM